MAKSQAKCPLCGNPAKKGAMPFCSDRCKDIDLNRWLGGSYSIPAHDQSPPDQAENDNEQPE